MTTQADKVKIFLAVYRGLPDNERNARRAELSRMPGHDARTLLRACEQVEAEISVQRRQEEETKRRLSALQLQVEQLQKMQQLAPGQADPYGGQANAEIRRGSFAAGLVFGGLGGVVYLLYTFGVWPVILASGGAYVLSRVFGGRGSAESDAVSQPASAAQSQTIVFQVVQNGSVTYEQKG